MVENENWKTQNLWTVEGKLGKFPNGGTGDFGPWYKQSISIYKGKSKTEDGKSEYENIGFFVPKDHIDSFKRLAPGTKIRLKGRPEANAYINKTGDLIPVLNIKLNWEDPYEVLEDQNQGHPLQDHSDEPF